MLRRILKDNFSWVLTPRDRILSAISEDSINWKRERGVRIGVGGNHKIDMAYYQFVHRPEPLDGLWEMFYQAGISHNGLWKNAIYSAQSKNGLDWIKNDQAILSNGSSELNHSQTRAPFLVDFGSYWRMYFSAKGADGIFRILSAVSVDRINWEIEEGVRISPEQISTELSPASGVSDTAIVELPSGEYRMYFTVYRQTEWFQEICSALSHDGIVWHMEAGVRIKMGGEGFRTIANNPSVIKTWDGYRMYFRGGNLLPIWNNIFTAFSNDGINWTIEGSALIFLRWHRYERHAVAFPYVLPIEDNKYRMYYTGYWGHLVDRPIIKHYEKLGKQQGISI
ncbi:MAG: hypothetical protein DWQ07_09060 [Chloroflexi bacterium]|nr:MAG: hypothetical protein DWQ07_09060 [Chloroflexota bacterium]MBL1193138.1 hypothetical protein [Chloroflexota bacterium]